MLFDDAMISMRYAMNLAHGQGLVWNPGGEHVEGFTNLLWTLYMSALHLAPASREHVSLLVQISCAVLLLLNVAAVGRPVKLLVPGNAWYGVLAAFLTATYYPLNQWGVLGMEVPLLMLLVTVAAINIAQSFHRNVFPMRACVLLGISTLVRLDMAVICVAVLISVFVLNRRDGSTSRFSMSFIAGVAAIGLPLIAQSIFRIWYYGDALPNTYYLKMTGFPAWPRIIHGLDTFISFVTGFNVILFLIPFISLYWIRDRAYVTICAIVAAQCLYSVYVGGDAWDQYGGSNRFISVVMPLQFALFAVAISRVWPRVDSFLRSRAGSSARFAALILAALCCLTVNSYSGSRSLREATGIQPILNSEYTEKMVQLGTEIRNRTSPHATIAVVWAGALPYFADRTAFDILGKSDRKIAREPAHLDPDQPVAPQFHPGHMKWDYGDLLSRRPDIIAQLWLGATAEETSAVEMNYNRQTWGGLSIYALKGSANLISHENDQ